MDRLTEIREYLAAIQTELAALDARSDLTDEDRTHVDELLNGFDALTTEAKPLAERAARLDVVRTSAIQGRTESGEDRGAPNGRRTADVFDMSTLPGYPNSPERGAELRQRAERIVDGWTHLTDEQRDSARSKFDSSAEVEAGETDDGAGVAALIVATSSPAYKRAFRSFIRHSGEVNALSTEDQGLLRAALNITTTTQGGYLVPADLDPSIILTNNSATNPFRQIASIKTTTTNQKTFITSAGVSAAWLAEATEVTDNSPTVASVVIPVYKAAAYVQASLEFIQDTDAASEISGLLADAKDRLEASAFAVGSGSGQPKGIVTALQAVTASRVAGSSGAAGAADIAVADIYALANALPPRHRPNSSWLAEQSTYNRVRQFGTANNYHAFWTDLGPSTPSQLLGRPVWESSEMDSTVISGSSDDVLILGDFRKYYIVDRIGMTLAYNPLVIGSSHRPTGEVGWVAFWRVGGDTVDPNAFRMLRV